ncbi:MAG: LysM peptidoglycan-binding domain-containing protein [Vicinamibacteria bacterium]|nr:LysM peptidoglycan-binding domain-containing protein [Vicinamibacteria bacterium]
MPSGSSAQISTGPATVAPHWSRNDYPHEIPEGAAYYIIQENDTLWDLAGKFLGNPFLWPQIWQENGYIRDAHWIYPGDPLLLPKIQIVSDQAGGIPGFGEEGAPSDIPGFGEEGVAGGTSSRRLIPVTEEITMLCSPYILKGSEEEGLKIIGSEQGADKVAFANNDIVYLNKGSNGGIKAGDVFTIHRSADTVQHPRSGRRLGTRIETFGTLRTILVQEDTSTAVIDVSCSDILAGSYLKPYEKPNVPVILGFSPSDRLTPPSGKARGYIVAIAENASITGAGGILSIDLGTEDGILPGTRLVAYRNAYSGVGRNVVGDIVVITTQARTATAKVMYSRDSLILGDSVEVQ